jgi:hypothetical protein
MRYAARGDTPMKIRMPNTTGERQATGERASREGDLIALDIDAIWWRDEASYTRPDALVQALGQDVLPHLRAASTPA